MTRWLSPDEQRVWRSFLRVNRQLFAVLEREIQVDAGIPHAYYEVLAALSEAPARTLRMSELAARALSSRSRLSHAVNRLEAVGWVRRDSCDADRRGAFAVLTDDGFAALERAAPAHVEAVRTHLFDGLDSRQVAALGAVLGTIERHMDELGAATCAEEC